MSRTEIDTMMWRIQREDMQRHGCDAAERDMQPLWWYINTGRASTEFLHKLMYTSPCMVARDLHKGGSYEEVINRVCRRIKYAFCKRRVGHWLGQPDSCMGWTYGGRCSCCLAI